ncbi:hypothetical protein [Botrimarina sp.]|uniref:hypothetical protein n=1 Tax=Botrimarina sp. TaxID=2795802 RepID=UPI0032F03604
MKTALARYVALAALLAAAPHASAATITDLTTWTLVEDPAHPNMSAVQDSLLLSTLAASGAVPSGTDIGFASLDGADAGASLSGYAFDPAQPFSVAIDFDVSAVDSVGGGAIGFGIGEDIDGVDSAGVVLGLLNGSPVAFLGSGRVGDVDVAPVSFPVVPFKTGRFFVDYDPAGPITLGINATLGAANPSMTQTLNGLPAQWDGEPLLVSFFLRSQSAGPISGFASGEVTAVFSNFAVTSGAPFAVPEPSALAGVVSLVGLAAPIRRR